jgi:hypothetical protein
MKGVKGISQRLRAARTLVEDLSARKLDELAGARVGLTRSIESGVRPNPTAQSIVPLCAVLGLTCDWLLTGSGDEPTTETVLAAIEKARRRSRRAA